VGGFINDFRRSPWPRTACPRQRRRASILVLVIVRLRPCKVSVDLLIGGPFGSPPSNIPKNFEYHLPLLPFILPSGYIVQNDLRNLELFNVRKMPDRFGIYLIHRGWHCVHSDRNYNTL